MRDLEIFYIHSTREEYWTKYYYIFFYSREMNDVINDIMKN